MIRNGYSQQQSGVFQVMNPEGEVYVIDTTNREGRFYGPAWADILSKRERGEFMRGRAAIRRHSRDDRFSGYSVDINGVMAFLPASKAGWFRDQGRDACGKFLALKAESVYLDGKLILNAYAPVNFVLNRQNRWDFENGAAIYALAVDHDGQSLIFPWHDNLLIVVPLGEAQRVAWNAGINNNPNELTGYYWRLGFNGWAGPGCQAAVPLEVLI